MVLMSDIDIEKNKCKKALFMVALTCCIFLYSSIIDSHMGRPAFQKQSVKSFTSLSCQLSDSNFSRSY